MCPLGFGSPDKFGGIDCILVHEMIHAITGESDETLVTKISQCYKGGCKAYDIPAK